MNDIFCRGRKVAGIPAEGVVDMESGRFEHAVLGMGVNVRVPATGFHSEIADVAGAVCNEAVGVLRHRLAAEMLARFWSLYENLPDRSFYDEYRRRCFLLGQPIVVTRNGSRVRARAVDLTEDFKLVVELPTRRAANCPAR